MPRGAGVGVRVGVGACFVGVCVGLGVGGMGVAVGGSGVGGAMVGAAGDGVATGDSNRRAANDAGAEAGKKAISAALNTNSASAGNLERQARRFGRPRRICSTGSVSPQGNDEARGPAGSNHDFPRQHQDQTAEDADI